MHLQLCKCTTISLLVTAIFVLLLAKKIFEFCPVRLLMRRRLTVYCQGNGFLFPHFFGNNSNNNNFPQDRLVVLYSLVFCACACVLEKKEGALYSCSTFQIITVTIKIT